MQQREEQPSAHRCRTRLNYSAGEPHPLQPTRRPAAALSIVVPTYNERDRLAELVAAIFSGYAQRRTRRRAGDRRRQLAGRHRRPRRRAGAARHRITVIHRAGKLGLGTAVVEGFDAADRADRRRDRRRSESSAATLLPRMLAAMRQRRAPTWSSAAATFPAAARRTGELSRLLMSRVACLLARGLTPVRDATSGLLPDPARSRARRPDLGRRLQDLPRAAGSRPAGDRSSKCLMCSRAAPRARAR